MFQKIKMLPISTIFHFLSKKIFYKISFELWARCGLVLNFTLNKKNEF